MMSQVLTLSNFAKDLDRVNYRAIQSNLSLRTHLLYNFSAFEKSTLLTGHTVMAGKSIFESGYRGSSIVTWMGAAANKFQQDSKW